MSPNSLRYRTVGRYAEYRSLALLCEDREGRAHELRLGRALFKR